jgi:hypothetical protein
LNDYVSILDPTAPAREQGRARVTGLQSLKGKVVGFIDNSKPNFNHLADDLGELLVTRYGVAAVVKHRKRAASMPASVEVMQDVKEKCDLVITGSGD